MSGTYKGTWHGGNDFAGPQNIGDIFAVHDVLRAAAAAKVAAAVHFASPYIAVAGPVEVYREAVVSARPEAVREVSLILGDGSPLPARPTTSGPGTFQVGDRKSTHGAGQLSVGPRVGVGPGNVLVSGPRVPEDQPLKRIGDGSHQESFGAISDVGWSRTLNGWQVIPSQDMKNRMDDDIFQSGSWYWRNVVGPAVGLGSYAYPDFLSREWEHHYAVSVGGEVSRSGTGPTNVDSRGTGW